MNGRFAEVEPQLKKEIKAVESITVDVSYKTTQTEINTDQKAFSHVLARYSDKFPREDKGVLDYFGLSEVSNKLNTLPIYKKADKHKNPALLRGIYKGGIQGEFCKETTPYIPLDIDVKAPDSGKNFKGENLPILKNELDNNNVFQYLQSILPIVFRSSSGYGIGGFVYVPELEHYANDTITHKRIAETIYIEIEKLIYKHTGVIVDLDPAQGAFRQIRNITGQQEPTTINKKPLAFSYKVKKVVKKSNKGVIQYRDNYINTGSIIQQFNQSQDIGQLLNSLPLFSTKGNRVFYENSPSRNIGSYSQDLNVLWNHSNTLKEDLGLSSKKVTPFDLVHRLTFNGDFKACIEDLKSKGYKDITPKADTLQNAKNKLKIALQDANNPDKLIYKFCRKFKLLSVDDKLKTIRDLNIGSRNEEYFYEYFKLNNTTQLVYDEQIIINKWVSEAIQKIITLTEEHDRILLKAETGSGKTTAFIKDFRRIKKDSKTLLIAPLTIIVDQLSAEYKNEPGISFLTGRSRRDDHMQALNSNFVVATYEQGIKHLEKNNFDYVIVDEAHQLVMANSYKANVIEQVTKQLQGNKAKLIGLSGTPNRLFESLGFRLIDIKQTESTRTKVDVIYWNAKPLQIVLNHIEKSDNSRRYLFRLNEIDTLYDIKKKLVEDETFKKSEILILHSSPQIKNSEKFKHLYLESRFSDNIKVVLTTSIIDEGLSIRDNFTDCVFINNDFAPKAESIKQFFARFRGGKNEAFLFDDININRTNFLYLKHTKHKKPRTKYNLVTDYSQKKELLNKDVEDLTFDEIKSSYKDFTDTRDFYHDDNKVNEFYLANHVLNQYYKLINRDQFIEYLKLNFNIDTRILSQPEKPAEAFKGTTKAMKKAKIFEMLTTDANNLLHQVKQYTFDKNLQRDIVVTGEIKKNIERFFVIKNIKMIESLIKSHLSLQHLGSDDIIENLTKDGKLKTSADIQNKIFEQKIIKTITEPKTKRDKQNAEKIRSVVTELKQLQDFRLKDFIKILRQKRINNFNKYTHSTLESLLKAYGIKFKLHTVYKTYNLLTVEEKNRT